MRRRAKYPVATLLIALPLALLPMLTCISAQADVSPRSLASHTHPQIRVIIRLESPPLVYAKGLSKSKKQVPDLQGKVAQQYVSTLKAAQAQVTSTVERVAPGAVVERSYQVVFNGLAVRLPDKKSQRLDLLRALPGVSAVYEECLFKPALYSSVPAIGTETLWAKLGGEGNAGTGCRVAILDSGIDVDHPMFDPTTFAYPEAFPKGDARYTTSKVIAARAYFRPTDPPLPEEEAPIPGPYGSSHGTHVAGIAAGNRVLATYRELDQEISGVAPRAYLMNYRIFYPSDESNPQIAYTAEILQAIEDAVTDGAQIICNSWSSILPRSPWFSPEGEALEAAIEAGCIVVAAAGNDGPGYGSASCLPGGLERLITVGAVSKSQIIADNVIDITGPNPVAPGLEGQPFAPAQFGGEISPLVGPLSYQDVAQVDPANSPMACSPLPQDSLAGKAVLISRGDCNFADKAYQAQEAGADVALIYNDTDNLVEMGCGGDHCDGEITIPVAMVSHSFGEGAIQWLALYPDATLQLDRRGRIVPTTANQIPESSGRGPAYACYLKPDLLAPGVSVFSASHDGRDGAAPYMQLSGNSVAAAHVAGAAALLLQLHPTFGHDEIKAALMATSQTSDIQIGENSPSVNVLSQGAGLIDLAKAASPALLFSPPSLSLASASPRGHYPLGLTLRDPRDSGATRTFDVSVTHSEGITVAIPAEISINANSEISLDLSIDVAPDVAPGDFEAYVQLADGDTSVHLPIWIHVVSPTEAATVLLIDNDFSCFESYTDYAPYVTDALDETGISYQVWDADAHFDNPQTIPSLEGLQQYKMIIWLTGDNVHPDGYYDLPTPLTAGDMQILASYLDAGGRILAMGQNLAEASDVNPDIDSTWGRSSFYHRYLGAHWLAGSLFDPNGEGNFPPQAGLGAVGLPDTFLSGVQLHLGGVGNGASNQTSIDEIAPGGVEDGSDLDLVQPLMVAVDGQPLANGYVALAKSDEPVLEKKFASIPYRSVYCSFGFEGINNTSTTTTRGDFLALTLDWLLDEVSVDLDQDIISSRNELTYISCNAASSVGAEIVSYRWDLGEGQGQFVTSDEPTIAHAFSSRGQHAIAVEVTDTMGHKAVAQGTLTIVKGGSSTLAVSASSVPRGAELRYTIVVRNTDAEALSLDFSLPLPPGTDYLSHTGGSYHDDRLTWSGVLDPDASFSAELFVRVRQDAQLGIDTIVAMVGFDADEDSFSKAVSTSVTSSAYLPVILK